MKSLVSFTAGLAAAAATFISAQDTDSLYSCSLTTAQLCPGCDGGNYTDQAGQDWAVSCDWAVDAELETAVEGETRTEICLNACEDSDDCYAVNVAANGSCVIALGHHKGLAFSPGFTNLARIASITAAEAPTSTFSTRLTVTPTPAGTRTAPAPFGSISSAPSPTFTGMSGQCDLSAEPEDICPNCHGQVAVDTTGAAYHVFCDTSLDSDGSYSVQEWLSPYECLEECDKLDFCTGATYNGDRSCELAKANPSAKYDLGNTALLPVLTPEPTPSATPSVRVSRAQAWNSTLTTPPPGPTATILPISSDCDTSAMTCPECNGAPTTDGLSGKYTALCGLEPSCLTTDRQDPTSQQGCLQLCADDATCLGALWFPESQNCNLCLRGMTTSRAAADSQFVLFAVDQDGEDEFDPTMAPTSNSTTKSSSVSISAATLPISLTRNITDLPRPFPTAPPSSMNTSVASLPTTLTRNITDLPRPFSIAPSSALPVGPVGPVSVASMPSVIHPSVGFGGPMFFNNTVRPSPTPSIGGPIFFNNTATGSSTSTALVLGITQVPVLCPASDSQVFIDSNSDNYFAIGCDSRFGAARSQFVSASDFEACAASCTGACDGIQFGYTSRCGLYTDISLVGPAAGWTVAASITFASQTPVLTSVDVSAIVSSTVAPVTPATTARSPSISTAREVPMPYNAQSA